MECEMHQLKEESWTAVGKWKCFYMSQGIVTGPSSETQLPSEFSIPCYTYSMNKISGTIFRRIICYKNGSSERTGDSRSSQAIIL